MRNQIPLVPIGIVNRLVCLFFGIKLADIKKRTRKYPMVAYRQIMMALCVHLGYSRQSIANHFGLTRATVTHAVRRTADMLATGELPKAAWESLVNRASQPGFGYEQGFDAGGCPDTGGAEKPPISQNGTIKEPPEQQAGQVDAPTTETPTPEQP